MKENEMIIVKQLPVIEETLKRIGKEVDLKVERALALECTDESKQEVKKARAELNKQKEELETNRKEVKNQILAPYMAMEEIYNAEIKVKFEVADKILKERIDTIEKVEIDNKKQEVIEYFEEYVTDKHIDFITFEQTNVNVTLSASLKSLKEAVKTCIDKVVNDLGLIETQEYKTEILVEYKNSFNVAQAITTVSNRYKAIQLEKEKQEALHQIKSQEEVVVAKVEEVLSAPTTIEKEIKEEVYEMTFTVNGTKEMLRQLKSFLIEGGYINE